MPAYIDIYNTGDTHDNVLVLYSTMGILTGVCGLRFGKHTVASVTNL